MSFPTQKLKPFTLYIIVSVPEEPPHTIAHRYDRDTSNIEVVRSQHTKQHEPWIIGSADFEWGLYWHRELGDGTWYAFRFTPSPMYKGPPGLYKPWVFSQHQVKESPRLNHFVVGLIRIMCVPESIGKEISVYLDWLAPIVAAKATRDDIWATTICLRTRLYVAKKLGLVDKTAEQFDGMGLIRQSMQFAYREV
ncbi:hypothetical protein FHETE_6188 [Fusarium heterosporum]|uniref:Uncharacterized protein n=1 Tax=Fusarium heterosporum TaxID=42747 RepID=A0A8H5WQE2_FUSHE|nr:hypothetical protein FHETE_6188 [Fusarium heterosporum]